MTDSSAGMSPEASPPPARFTLAAGGAEVDLELVRPLPGGSGLLMQPVNGGPNDRVVVKRLKERHSPATVGRLRGLAALDHPAIALVLGWGDDGHGLYVVRDYIRGRTLDDVLALREKISASQLLKIGIGLSGALDFAHTRQPRIVHGRLTPSNVILTTGSEDPRLVDFAPGSLLEPRTDIKALGILLLRLFAQCGAAAHFPPGSDRVLKRAQSGGFESAAEFAVALRLLLGGHEETKALERDPTIHIETGEGRGVVVCQNPDCSEINPADSKACSRCGAKLWRTCPGCGEDYLPEEARCPSCRTDPESIAPALKLVEVARGILADGDALGAHRIVERGIRLLSREEGATHARARAEELKAEIRELLDQRDRLAKGLQGLLAAHRYDDAMKRVETSLDEDPGNKDAMKLLEEIPRRKRAHLLALSLEAEATHDLNRTLDLAAQAASGAPADDDEARLRLSAVRRKVKALATLQKDLKKSKHEKDFAGMLAACEGANEEFRDHPLLGKAREWAEQRIEAYGEKLEEANRALEDQGWTEATRLFRAAGDMWPHDDRAREGQKRVLVAFSHSLVAEGHEALKKGDYEQASAAFHRALEIRPGSEEAKQGIRRLNSRRRRRRFAKVAVLLLFVLGVAAFGAAGPIASWLLSKGDYEHARQIYDLIPVVVHRGDLERDLAKFLGDRAAAKADAGDHDGAIMDLRDAVAILAGTRELDLALRARRALVEEHLAAAKFHQEAGRIEKALRIAKEGGVEAIAIHPECAEERHELKAIAAEVENGLREQVRQGLLAGAVLAVREPPGVLRLVGGREVKSLAHEGGSAECEIRDGWFLVPVEFDGEGPRDLELVARLASGPEVALTVRVACDKTPPEISLGAKVLRVRPGRSTITVGIHDQSLEWDMALGRVWAALDEGGPAVEGVPGPARTPGGPSRDYAFDLDLGNRSGERKIVTVRARDGAGNEGEARLALVVDGESEPVTLRARGDGVAESRETFFTQEANVTLEGVTADVLPRSGPLDECFIEVARDGGQRDVIALGREDLSISEMGGTEIRRQVPLASGENRFVLHIRDEAGNEPRASKEILVVRDLEPPVVNIRPVERAPDRFIRDTPNGPIVLANRDIEIVVEIRENWPDRVTVTIDGSKREVPPESGSFPIPIDRPGTHAIEVEAVDRAGASAKANCRITFYPVGDRIAIRDGARLIYVGPPGANKSEQEMVFVPAGEVRGEEHVPDQHVGAFLIDKDETLNPTGPIAYAEADNLAGKRGLALPSEAEWVLAALHERSHRGSVLKLDDDTMEWVRGAETEVVVRGRADENHPTGKRFGYLKLNATVSPAFRCVLRLGR